MEWAELVLACVVGGGIAEGVRWYFRVLERARPVAPDMSMMPDVSAGQTYCAVITDDGNELYAKGVLAPFRKTLRVTVEGHARWATYVRLDKRGRFLYEVVP